MLRRLMWLACEQLKAPRPLARPGRKICQKIRSALALALLGLCRAWLGHGRRWPRPLPRAVTPALGLPLLLAVRRRPITPCRLPASPLPGRFLARLAAIALQRMGRLEALLASFQQADVRIATGRLTRRVGREILRWAHGRSCSQRSSLGGGLRTRRRGVFIGTVASAWQRQASGARRRRPLAAMRDGEPTAVGGWSSTRVAVIDMRAAGRPLAAILAYMVAAADNPWTGPHPKYRLRIGSASVTGVLVVLAMIRRNSAGRHVEERTMPARLPGTRQSRRSGHTGATGERPAHPPPQPAATPWR